MKSLTTTIITEATFSDDNRHRYALKKVWNDKRPLALIVSKSAGSDDGVFETLTQTIITNNLYKLGYGGFCLCNLFSSINGKDSDKDNIQLIKELANSKDYPDIIICWGCLSASKESIQEQAIKVVNILANVKKKNIYTVSNGIATNCHPLSPSVKGKKIIGKPKTESSDRKILMPDYVVTMLKKHKIEQAKNRLKLGRAYQDNDLVYCYDDGTPRSTNGFSKRFSDFLEKNGLRHIRFHDLRHINATLMLQYGVPAKIASERLGHSTIQTTMNIYSHVTVEMQKDTVNIFDNNIFSKVAEG